jgi:hypothetical protein
MDLQLQLYDKRDILFMISPSLASFFGALIKDGVTDWFESRLFF